MIAATIGLLFCLLQAGAMASLLANHAAFRWVAPAAMLGALVAGYLLAGWEGFTGRSRFQPLIWSVAILVVAAGLAAFYYDLSWDGEWYHQTAILGIARGWDPLTQPLRSFAAPLETWVRHYPKGPWYAAAAIFSATGRIELGKAIDGLAFAALFCAVLGAALDLGLSRSRACALAFLVALNPVVVCELTSYLVDGIMFAFLAVATAAVWTCLAARPRPAVLLAGISASVACINAKFTGLVFLGFVAAAAAIWCFFHHRGHFRRFIVTSALVFLVGAGVWGYNPYVTNTIFRGQPFYPVFGAARYHDRDPQLANEHGETPKNMVGKSRFIRFGYAIFGRPGNQPYRQGRNASLMWPFGARMEDLYAYTFQDPRIAALGPYFSGCLLISLALGIGLAATDRRRWTLGLICGTIVGSLLISPALWWPRYGPQLWLLPIVPLMFAFGGGKGRGPALAAWVLAGLLTANAGIVGWVRFHWETEASRRLRGQLAEMKDSGSTYDVSTGYFTASADERLAEAGVRFQDVGNQRHPDWTELTSVVEGYPLATRYHPSISDHP
ncbi:MAG TPA: hypothetical protein VMD08_15435 [Candidatus Baltobacteraceae bacterium]|nr:hypothetical protein [Candidatus Baltobacteraceae bacterium]